MFILVLVLVRDRTSINVVVRVYCVIACNRVCSQGDALRHSLLTLYLGASYNQGLAGPSPAIANASAHGPPAAPSTDKDSPDAKGGGVSLAIRNDLSLVETQVSVERLTSYS